MKYRFRLRHEVLGTFEISAPEGWKAAKIRLERSPDFHSLVEFFGGSSDDDNAGSFTFYGSNGFIDGGLDIIKQVIREYGPDSTLVILIDVTYNGYIYKRAFEGQLALFGVKFNWNNTVEIPIIRNNFWAKFKNRLDTPVDIQSPEDLDQQPADVFDASTLNLTSQLLPMTLNGVSDELAEEEIGSIQDFPYYQMSWNDLELEEIEEYFLIPQVGNPVEGSENFVVKYGGSYRFQGQTAIYLMDYNFIGDTLSDYIRAYINIDGVETEWDLGGEIAGMATIEDPDSYENGRIFHLDITANLNAGSIVKFYFKVISNLNFGGSDFTLKWNGPISGYVYQTGVPPCPFIGGCSLTSWIDITGQTEYPQTQADGFMVHDAAGQITDRIIGRTETFYSENLGSDLTRYRQYEQNGCNWEYAIAKGLQIRNYSLVEKPFFLSFKQWWDGMDPILNLGLGYDKIDGKEVIRVEEKSFFYDQSQVSVYLSNIREIDWIYDDEYIFKSARTGYKTGKAENVSGIDDPQKQTRASRLQKGGRAIVVESEFIAAPYAWETTRRTTREKSADYKFDDNTFIVSVRENPGSPANDFIPKLDEDFSSITNLSNASTRYNSILTPARNFLRWLNFFSIGLQDYLSSVFKFTSGEGNYDMTSDYDVSDGCDEYQGNLSEKQDIPVSDQPLFTSQLLFIDFPMEWEDYLLIAVNPTYAIGISQTDYGHIKCFIKELTFEPVSSRVNIQCWTTEFFDKKVIDYPVENEFCTPGIVTLCEDAYLTEISDTYITESGDCLILN